MDKHTPGPWQFDDAEEVLWSGDGNTVVCIFNYRWSDADKQLVATAPDLLAACEWVARGEHHTTCSWGKTGAGTTCDCYVGAAQQAIAKATKVQDG